jgi:DNA polymerase III alpha subunit
MTESDLIKLNNRVIDKQGNVVYFNEALMEMLYNNNIPETLLYSEYDCDVKAFNKLAYENYDNVGFNLPKNIKSLESRKESWFYPPEYDKINLNDYFNNLCSNEIERNRVSLELNLYKEKNMEKFLRFCIYLSDKIRENDWVIGVGRGSSVASYILYKLKIHLIDSIKYGLDIKEFLK